MASYILKSKCLIICFDKLGLSSFYYMVYYLAKHSSFRQKIISDFSRYALEIYKTEEKYILNENNGSIENNFAEKYTMQIFMSFASDCYYGIPDNIKPDKEKALIYFKKAYQLSKEKNYETNKRENYLYIYKCRKYLFKNNKISLRKLNKTKEKLN